MDAGKRAPDRWRRVGSGMMALLGLLMLLPAAWLALSAGTFVASGTPDPCEAMGCGSEWILLAGGLVMTGLGVLYLLTARALWTRRHRARAIAVALLLPFVLPAAVAVVTELFGRQSMASTAFAVPWGITLFAVIRARP